MIASEGKAIGALIAILNPSHAAPPETSLARSTPQIDEVVSPLLDCLGAGDHAGALLLYSRLEQSFSPSQLIDRVIAPALIETGERWYRREFSVYQERLATGFLRRKLVQMIEASSPELPNAGKTIVAGTMEGDLHEGGLLIFNQAMQSRGWKVHNLGVDLPFEEFRTAIRDLNADALAISFVLSRNITKRFGDLARIREVPVFVGGRSILNYQTMAREHGLIPLPGPISRAVDQFDLEFKLWNKAHP